MGLEFGHSVLFFFVSPLLIEKMLNLYILFMPTSLVLVQWYWILEAALFYWASWLYSYSFINKLIYHYKTNFPLILQDLKSYQLLLLLDSHICSLYLIIQLNNLNLNLNISEKGQFELLIWFCTIWACSFVQITCFPRLIILCFLCQYFLLSTLNLKWAVCRGSVF